MRINAAGMLWDTAREAPDTVALIHSGTQITYAELVTRATTFGRDRVNHGDRIVLVLPNSIDFVSALFGAMARGATVVPVNILASQREIEHVILDADASLVVTNSRVGAHAMAAAESLGRRVLDLDSSGQVDSSEASLELPVSTSADDIALILYTSGTTGRPKGACLSHSSVAWIAEILALRVIRATSADVLLGVLPLSHIFGLIAVLSVSVVSAAQVVLEERFDAVRALNTIEEYGVTIFEGVPAMCPALLDAQAARGGPPPSTLRLAFLGGQSTPVEILRRFEATFRCNVIESYGTTETGSAITATPASGLDDSFVGTVGRPLRGVSVKILGEGGQELGAGEVGEIVVQSVGTMARYHGNDEATALVLRDGWFRTGDLGRRDERDVITVVDRKKEVILRRGYNVYPREVEEVLYEHPAVAEAAVIGVDDGSGGEEVAAVVAVKTGSATDERELREFVRSRVASYKYPRIVAIVDALPKNSTGKISKKAIDRQQIVEMSGAQLAENPRGENSESSTQRQSRWKG